VKEREKPLDANDLLIETRLRELVCHFSTSVTFDVQSCALIGFREGAIHVDHEPPKYPVLVISSHLLLFNIVMESNSRAQTRRLYRQ
jgi:hypothetical protein